MRRSFFKTAVAITLLMMTIGVWVSGCTTSPEAILDVGSVSSGPRYGDNNPHEWSSTAPWGYPVHGIDVSKFQRTINWSAVRSSGIRFAFIKATEGGDHVDSRFKENWRAAKRAGVARGAYHFYYFCRPAIEQARWFVSHVPRERGALPPVLDMEWNSKSPTCRLRPHAKKVRAEMEVFLKYVRRHYGQTPIVYSTVDFYRDNELSKISDVEFWLRTVADHPDKIYPGQYWTFWQYTGTGKIPGISGDADINVFRGDHKAWKNWVKQAAKK